jgi:hypothetical protein
MLRGWDPPVAGMGDSVWNILVGAVALLVIRVTTGRPFGSLPEWLSGVVVTEFFIKISVRFPAGAPRGRRVDDLVSLWMSG